MSELAPNCKEMLQGCQWKGEEKRCESIFEEILSTEGYCCSFNYYALKNHTFRRYVLDSPHFSRSAFSYIEDSPNDSLHIDHLKHEILLCSSISSKIPLNPRRVSACGYLTALEVVVDSNASDYFATQISTFGNKVKDTTVL